MSRELQLRTSKVYLGGISLLSPFLAEPCQWDLQSDELEPAKGRSLGSDLCKVAKR